MLFLSKIFRRKELTKSVRAEVNLRFCLFTSYLLIEKTLRYLNISYYYYYANLKLNS